VLRRVYFVCAMRMPRWTS